MRVELGRASASYATGSEYSLMARIVPLQFGALRGDEVVDYLRILKKLHDKHPSYVLAKRLHKKAMANGEKSPLIDELEGIFS